MSHLLAGPQVTGLVDMSEPLLADRPVRTVTLEPPPGDSYRRDGGRLLPASETAAWCANATSGQPDRVMRGGRPIPSAPASQAGRTLLLAARPIGNGPLDGGDPTWPAVRAQREGLAGLLIPRNKEGLGDLMDDYGRLGSSGSGPGPGPKREGIGLPAAIAPSEVTLGYRAVEFQVPVDWYLAWLAEWHALGGTDQGGDLCSSTADLLSAVWPEYTAALASHSGLDDDTVDSVLGCFSLLSTADQALFWRTAWGPSRQVYRLAARLIAIYSDDIQDDWMDPFELPTPSGGSIDFSWCDGLGDFCRNAVKGRRATTRRGGRTCPATINYDGYDLRFWLDHSIPRCSGAEGRACGRYFNPSGESCHNPKFDEEMSDWVLSGWDEHYRAWTRVPGLPPAMSYEDLDCTLLGIGGGFNVTMRPNHLQWCGFVTDRVLHLARIAHDYARYLDGLGRGPRLSSSTWQTAAVQLGRYALGPALELGLVLVHELGHSYMGEGGHCEYQCCFDAGARAWQWRVRGRLGLPARLWHSDWIWYGSAGNLGLASAQQEDFGGDRLTYTATFTGGACGDWFGPTSTGLVGFEAEGYYDATLKLVAGVPDRSVSVCFSDGRQAESSTGLVVSRWQTQTCGRVLA